jgi:hypothetical protein
MYVYENRLTKWLIIVFSNIGPTEQADSLGLGLMLAWIPVLVLSSIVDRNPANSSAVEDRLNLLIGGVRKELIRNPDLKQRERLGSLPAPPHSPGTQRGRRNSMAAPLGSIRTDWINALEEQSFQGEFFVGFGGQGRRRWHYGVANAVLAGLEDEFIKAHGRDWLGLDDVRDKLVKPRRSPGIYFFDLRELWHVAGSGLVVVGTMFGAFILNYFTPPIGIGCRTGGYVIFCSLVTLSFVVEMAVWWWTSNQTGDEFLQQEKWERRFFIPMEIIVLSWLLYMVIAQSVGLYQTCWCLAWQSWFNLTTAKSWTGPNVKGHWVTALVLTLIIMLLSFAFIIAEWCTQSHMATYNYEKAMRGLRRTRTFKWLTSPIREIADFGITKSKSLIGRKRRSLIWKKDRGQVPDSTVLTGSAPMEPDEIVEEVHKKCLSTGAEAEKVKTP